VGIRIANGGAGYTGLLRALSEAYLAKHPTIAGQPFSIAWYATNTTYSYHALRDHIVDVALVYEIWPEAMTGKKSYGQKLSLLFNDAFIFVGPESNPAGIIAETSSQTGDSMDSLLEKIILTGCQKPFAQGCSMYLSRSDLSGTYKKETTYLISHRTPQNLIGNSPWYYPHPSTPREALQEASQKSLYTLNDKSTWVSHPALQQGLKIYADGSFGHDPNLRNPCYGLLAKPPYLQSGQPLQFLKWMRGPEGRKIIATYGQKEFGAPVVKAPWH
jgi:ABC-type tungstate transport system permease subunit